jgi:LmbE family N-acetylglucosaminyl deacetylase
MKNSLAVLLFFSIAAMLPAQPVQLEKLENKTILLFTPHPDDDTFCCAGTLTLLARRQNNIHIFIYTNDDKGSYDLDMTGERLAAIRKVEEENSCKALGIPQQNIHWLQFHDGMLEYANPLDLVQQVTKIIRTYRPHVVMTIDPGPSCDALH